MVWEGFTPSHLFVRQKWFFWNMKSRAFASGLWLCSPGKRSAPSD